MARLGVIYENRAAQQFRAAIRPSLYGQLGNIEPNIAAEAANALGIWMVEVVQAVLRETTLKDKHGEVAKQLYAGIRIYGRASLTNLRSVVVAYPWLRIHEFGGTIEPKGHPYLAIPIFDGLRADGSPKFLNPRSWNRFGSFVYMQKATGKKFLAYRSTSGQLRTLYILVDQVTLQPVLGLVRTAGAMLGSLMAVWGQIYLAEATKPQYRIFDLWDGAYR